MRREHSSQALSVVQRSSLMNVKTSHHVTIAGAPASWRMHSRVNALLDASVRAKFLKPNTWIVLSVHICKTSEMVRLNARYRGKRADTDILSFEQPGASPKGFRFLGDLVLSSARVRAQAKAHRHSIGDELDVLLVHGLLHLLGYDHERSRREHARMLKAETRLLKAMRGRKSPVSGLTARTS